MPFLVQLTDNATRDLMEICDSINQHDASGMADHVLEQIEKAFSSLSEHPHRGNDPKELLDVGIREYREIFFKPYRVIYQVMDNNVYVLVIADGRRDMQTLLQLRLLQGSRHRRRYARHPEHPWPLGASSVGNSISQATSVSYKHICRPATMPMPQTSTGIDSIPPPRSTRNCWPIPSRSARPCNATG